MSDLISESYARLLDSLPPDDPWPALEDSGFLDLLRPAAEGDDEPMLETLFSLGLSTGRRLVPAPVLETLVARRWSASAVAVTDLAAIAGRPTAAAIAAVQMAGAMAELLDMTVEYAGARRQFGRDIGRFQAVQQQIAVMAEEVAAARMAAQMAFVGRIEDLSERRAGIAKLRASRASETVVAVAHAVHGAIGISQEHRLHHYAGRLRRWRLSHGGESWWAERLGESLLADTRDLAAFARLV